MPAAAISAAESSSDDDETDEEGESSRPQPCACGHLLIRVHFSTRADPSPVEEGQQARIQGQGQGQGGRGLPQEEGEEGPRRQEGEAVCSCIHNICTHDR